MLDKIRRLTVDEKEIVFNAWLLNHFRTNKSHNSPLLMTNVLIDRDIPLLLIVIKQTINNRK